jgi:hypothetical protein
MCVMVSDAMRAERNGRSARANARAADLAPTIKNIQVAGTTSLRGIADALNARNVPTARGEGRWQASQVMRVLRRLPTAA